MMKKMMPWLKAGAFWRWFEVGTAWGVVLALVLTAAYVVTKPRETRAANGDPGYPTSGTIYAQGYNKDRQMARFRAGLSVADSASLSVSMPTLANTYALNGRPTLSVSCRFSAISHVTTTQSCAIKVVWLYAPDSSGTMYVLGGSHTLTAQWTSIDVQDRPNPTTGMGDGYYMAPELTFDGHGATNAFIMLESAPAAGGTVDLWVGSF